MYLSTMYSSTLTKYISKEFDDATAGSRDNMRDCS